MMPEYRHDDGDSFSVPSLPMESVDGRSSIQYLTPRTMEQATPREPYFSARGHELLAAFLRGFIVRYALALIWPQIHQTHDVYAMIIEMESSGQDSDFIANLYRTLRRQFQELGHVLRRAKF